MKNNIIVGVFGSLVGLGLILLFAIVGINTQVRIANLIDNGSETTAVIVQRWVGGGGQHHTSIRIYVSYTVDGMAYRNRLYMRPDDAYVGQEVAILYNPDAPRQITVQDRALSDWVNESIVIPLLTVGVGALLLVASIRIWRKGIKEKAASG